MATFLVTTNSDTVDENDGLLSLREAIIEANSTTEDDTIELSAEETYNLTLAGEDDAAAVGDLDISGNGSITILGNGATIDADRRDGIDDRVFEVLENGNLKLENATVTGGRSGGSGLSEFDYYGGGILNRGGNITLTSSTISGNSGGVGGGIYGRGGTITITDSTISDNYAGNYGGGIFSRGGDITIVDSTIDENSASYGTAGIYNSGKITIVGSTISGNISSKFGVGGIEIFLGTGIIEDSIVSYNGGSEGGGITNSGDITINNSTISGNLAFGYSYDYYYSGGGIKNRGNITITNSTISGNSAEYGGGGINNVGTATVENSVISGNSAEYGGGINNSYNYYFSDDYEARNNLRIANTTISNNNATNAGGGIRNNVLANNPNYTTTIINSTISGNSSPGEGGAILQESGTLNISNSTITDNQASTGSGLLSKEADYSETTLTSTIVAGNSNNDDLVEQGVSLISGDNNLIGNGDAATGFTNGVNQDIVGTASAPINPLLEPLANNGGFLVGNPNSQQQTVLTHALLDGSPAVNAGSNPEGLSFDQRGAGFERVVDDLPDIGAFELALVFPGLELEGGNGQDTLIGSEGNDTIVGGNGQDKLVGRAGDDSLEGGNGKDLLIGNVGNDILYGNGGIDVLFGNSGDDALYGNGGRDVLVGGSGNDVLYGGNGKDVLIGTAGNNSLYGGNGNDELTGGLGRNRLAGGSGADTFVLTANQGKNTITDFNNRDLIGLSGGISFGDLSFSGNDIVLASNNQVLATVVDVDTTTLRAKNFTVV